MERTHTHGHGWVCGTKTDLGTSSLGETEAGNPFLVRCFDVVLDIGNKLNKFCLSLCPEQIAAQSERRTSFCSADFIAHVHIMSSRSYLIITIIIIPWAWPWDHHQLRLQASFNPLKVWPVGHPNFSSNSVKKSASATCSLGSSNCSPHTATAM